LPRPKGAKDADHAEKRSALLQRMMQRIMRREPARPSLRQLAEAAGVSVPTLRHYFGGRAEVVQAILEEYRSLGDQRLRALEHHPGTLEESVRDYVAALIKAVREPRAVRLADVFAVSLAEGMLDRALGPAALAQIVDPSVEALQKRLAGHVARGQMIVTDTRAAALVLLSPLLIAILHQDQMGGAACNPVDLEVLGGQIADAFIRAYKAP
jgi:AcrR family transcriptional regulator